MKAKLTGLLALTIFTVMAVSFCQAQTAYVSDMLILTFREGPGATYAVKQTLKSDTPLTVLEEQNGFLKVELASGDQGWVDKNFIMFNPPKAVIIERLTREKQELEAELQTLKGTSSALATTTNDNTSGPAADLTRLKQENKKITQALKQTRSELSTLKQAAQNVSGTLEENKRLKKENKTLTDTVSRLKNNSGNDNDSIFRSAMIKWFLAGFGVLLTGWIIGRSVSPKRRSGSLLD